VAAGRISSSAINDSEEPFLRSDAGPEIRCLHLVRCCDFQRGLILTAFRLSSFDRAMRAIQCLAVASKVDRKHKAFYASVSTSMLRMSADEIFWLP
jgi:hypothetical protein